MVSRDPARASGASPEAGPSGEDGLWRAVFEGIAEPVYVLDSASGDLVHANRAALEALGYELDELTGQPFEQIYVDEMGAHGPKALLERALEEGETEAAMSLHERKDGTTFPVELTARTVEHGGKRLIVAVASDVSDWESDRIELQATKDRYRRLVELSPEPILVHDGETILYVNPACLELVGAEDASELVGEGLRTFVSPDDWASARKRIEAVLNGGDPPPLAKLTAHRLDGGEIRVELRGARIDYEGTPAVQVAMRDVTARDEVEAQLEAYAAELEAKNAALEQSNQHLQDFAYIISHDLREPLRMVKSYVELLARRYEGELDEAAHEFIHYAVDGAERMEGLIRGLLEFSRVQSRGKPFKPTDLEGVLEDAMANLTMQLEETGAKITHDPLPTLLGDRGQLVQVFQNLLHNAVKFRGTEPPRVNISAERVEDGWEIAFQDNGIGIEPKQQARIFQLFQRLHAPDEYEGIGMGLSICERIAERHGGSITLESEPGNGSTFKLFIPD